VTRRIEFDAAHRVYGHESKCGTVHGHRYVAEITAQAADLDNIGRVVDFSVIKEAVGGWIDKHWDHTGIVFVDDVETKRLMTALPGYKPMFISAWNPTAENMANHLLREVCPMVLKGYAIRVVKVRLYETPNCWADAEI